MTGLLNGIETQQHTLDYISINCWNMTGFLNQDEKRLMGAPGFAHSAFWKKRTPIDAYDVLIAGTALANQGILVTNNSKEFSRVYKTG